MVAHADDLQKVLQFLGVAQVLDRQPEAVHHQQSVTPQLRFIRPERLLAVLHNQAGEQPSDLFLPGQETATIDWIFFRIIIRRRITIITIMMVMIIIIIIIIIIIGDVMVQLVERRPRYPLDSMTRGSNAVRSTRKICESFSVKMC